jgi:hypothetical protein
VYKSLAPVFTTLFSLCYLDAVLPYSAIYAVSRQERRGRKQALLPPLRRLAPLLPVYRGAALTLSWPNSAGLPAMPSRP